jgi:small basic protein
VTTSAVATTAREAVRAFGCPPEGRPVAFTSGSPQVEAGRQVLVPLAGLLVGIILGLVLNVNVGYELARYSAVAILAALDSVLGAIRAELDGAYDNRIFISGFVTNAIVAVLLTFVGDRLGLDLYLVALITFGLRIFQNVALIRRHFL